MRAATFDAGPAARGTCLLLHGQTEFIEKYDEVIAELLARGFSVATFDWRGQGASARALSDRRKVHVEDFEKYDSDLAAFLSGIAAPMRGPKIALAHSMGAHILLRALYRDPATVAAAVLTAPMLKINLRGHSERFARMAARVLCLSGRGGDFVWGTKERDPRILSFAENFVTRDETRWRRWQEAVRADETLCVNGPTWRWLKAALASMRTMRTEGFAQKIATPLLIFGAGGDRVVETRATKDFAARAPNASYIEIQDSEHEILMERDAIRARFWQEFDAFIARSAV